MGWLWLWLYTSQVGNWRDRQGRAKYYGSGNKVKKRAPPVWIFKIKEILVVYFGSFSTVEAKVIVMEYIFQMVEFRVFVPQY